MLASLASRPPPPGLARLLRARPWLSPSRAAHGAPAAAEGAGTAGPRLRLLPVLAARGRRDPTPPPCAGLSWRGAAWGGRPRGPAGGTPVTGLGPGGGPLLTGPGPGGSPLAAGPGPGGFPIDTGPGPKGIPRAMGGSPQAVGPGPGVPPIDTGPGPGGAPRAMGGFPIEVGPGLGVPPIDTGPGPKGTPMAEGLRPQVPGLSPLRTPRPRTAGPAGAGCPLPGPSGLVASLGEASPWPSGAERRCRGRGDPGGRRSRDGSCPPGAALPALIAALAYCYVRDHRSKGDYCHLPTWLSQPRGGRGAWCGAGELAPLGEGARRGPALQMEPGLLVLAREPPWGKCYL